MGRALPAWRATTTFPGNAHTLCLADGGPRDPDPWTDRHHRAAVRCPKRSDVDLRPVCSTLGAEHQLRGWSAGPPPRGGTPTQCARGGVHLEPRELVRHL